MDPNGNTLGMQVNTPLAYSFYQIDLAGWNTTSIGNVEAPGGYVSMVNIEPIELEELINACDLDTNGFLTPYPGHYILQIDSDGNKQITEYLSKASMLQAFNAARREFVRWDATLCAHCGLDDVLENATMDGAIKKCIHCGVTQDPADGLDEVTI